MADQGFFTSLRQAAAANQSLLCLGLDPEVGKFPSGFMPGHSNEERLAAWCLDLIHKTADLICCVKPNIAFFEQYGPEGLKALQQVIAGVPAGIPVLLDAKRGDIGSTASAYAKAVFEVLHADGVTLSPYLGRDSVDPFLASGKQSPIYVDLRRVISNPALLRQAAAAYASLASALTFDCLAAVPYAALPATAAVALEMNKPMIYPRKEAKAHGTGQMVEGVFEKGQVALAVEDVITSGGSILTAIKTLEEGGLVVKDVIVLVDRNQGGHQAMAGGGYNLHAVLTIDEIVESLRASGKLDADMYQTVKAYLDESHVS